MPHIDVSSGIQNICTIEQQLDLPLDNGKSLIPEVGSNLMSANVIQQGKKVNTSLKIMRNICNFPRELKLFKINIKAGSSQDNKMSWSKSEHYDRFSTYTWDIISD